MHLAAIHTIDKLEQWSTKYQYLQWHIRFQVKLGNFVVPGHEALGLLIDVVVEDSPCGWELDGLELLLPPLAKLNAIVDALMISKNDPIRCLIPK